MAGLIRRLSNAFSFRLAVAATTPLLLASCGSSDASPGGAFSSSWALEGPDVRIGAVDDPDYAFPQVMDLAVGPDGSLYSLHRQESQVRRWTSDGQAAGTVGREGEGPGEFSRPSALGFFGDTLWVMDSRLYRVSFFTPDGEVLGTVSPRYQMGGGDASDEPWASPPRPSRPLRDGTFLAVSPAWSEAIARGNLTSVPHVRTDAEGEVLSTIWRQPYRTTDVLALLREDGGTFTSQPFGDAPLSALSSDGGFLVVDRRAHPGDGPGSFGVSKIGVEGDTLFRREFPYEPEPLSEERLDSAVRARAQGLHGFMSQRQPDLSLARVIDDLREATYAPAHLPPLKSLQVATDGTIWLERFQAAADGSTEWWILNPDGEPAGQAHTPGGLRVLLIHGDEVWGVESDELDVDYIMRYRLDRGS